MNASSTTTSANAGQHLGIERLKLGDIPVVLFQLLSLSSPLRVHHEAWRGLPEILEDIVTPNAYAQVLLTLEF